MKNLNNFLRKFIKTKDLRTQFTFTDVCVNPAGTGRPLTFKDLNRLNPGGCLKRLGYWGVCSKALKQCQQTKNVFHGSLETLLYIQRVEEALRKFVDNSY